MSITLFFHQSLDSIPCLSHQIEPLILSNFNPKYSPHELFIMAIANLKDICIHQSVASSATVSIASVVRFTSLQK